MLLSVWPLTQWISSLGVSSSDIILPVFVCPNLEIAKWLASEGSAFDLNISEFQKSQHNLFRSNSVVLFLKICDNIIIL